MQLSGEKNENATDEPWWVLALKVAFAMACADLVARTFGYAAPTLAVITAGFIAGQPTKSSIGKALRRFAASVVGVVAGSIAVEIVSRLELPRSLVALAIGAGAGAWRSRSNDYLYLAVVGIVVAFEVESSDLSTLAVAREQTVLATIACVVAPLVVIVIDAALGRMRHSG